MNWLGRKIGLIWLCHLFLMSRRLFLEENWWKNRNWENGKKKKIKLKRPRHNRVKMRQKKFNKNRTMIVEWRLSHLMNLFHGKWKQSCKVWMILEFYFLINLLWCLCLNLSTMKVRKLMKLIKTIMKQILVLIVWDITFNL